MLSSSSRCNLHKILGTLLASWLVLTASTAAAQATRAPVAQYTPAPELPLEGETASAEIALLLTVDAEGAVSEVVIETEGLSEAQRNAVEATARSWRFEPARRDDKPMAARIRMRTRFAEHVTMPVTTPPTPVDPPKRPPAVTGTASGEQITIHGASMPTSAAGSDYVLHVGQLRDVPRRSAEQLLTLAPGVLLTNHGGEGHASQIFLRGFDAGEGQDIEFRVEGMPLNEVSNPHGHGYADTHFVINELVDSLRIVEGPFDPRQGDFAVAGSAYYRLGLPRRGITTKAEYGSFGWKRGLLLWGPSNTSTRSFAGIDAVQGNGFGPNRAHASARLMAQHELHLGRDTTLTLLVTGYTARFDSAGLLRDDDFRNRRLSACAADERSQFFCSYDNNQGGASDRQSVSLKLERHEDHHTYGMQVFGVLRHLRLRQNLTGFTTDVSTTGEPQRGDNAEQSYDAVTVGTRGDYTFEDKWNGRKQHFELGYFLRHDDGSAGQRRLRTEGAVPYRVNFDNAFRITNIGVHAAGNLRPTSWLTVTGGLRADGFGFAVTDRNQPVLDRSGERLSEQSTDAYGLSIQPRVAVEAKIGAGFAWVGSAGVGTRSSDAQALSQGEFAPFGRVYATETGITSKYVTPDVALDTRMLGYYTRVDRDLLFDEQAGRNVLVGSSNRFGALTSARFTSRAGIDAQTSITYAEAYLPPAEASWLDLTAGNRMPYIPRWVSRTDLSARRVVQIAHRKLRVMGALGTTYVAPRPLPANQLSPALFTADLAASLRYKSVELGVELMNVFNRMNRSSVYNYVSNFRGGNAPASMLPVQHFSAASPRTFLASLTVHFGAEDHDDEL